MSDDELQAWLRHAEAMIYPSFVEGWGMPVAEALSMGVPVICSDITPFREVGQGVATCIDPLDGLALLAQIQRIIENVETTPAANYRPPSWEEHFERVDELVDRLVVEEQEGS